MDLCMPWMPAATYFGPMAAAVGLSYVLTQGAREIAPKLGLVDRPDGGRKRHHKPTPVMGGVAFVTAIFAVVGLAAALGADWLAVEATSRLAVSLGASAACFCLLGVCDDRWPLSPRVKLLGQIFSSLPFVSLNGAVATIGLLGWEIPLGPLGGPVSVLWLVACANVVNLIDGLDGLAGSIGLVVMITIAALFGLQGHASEALLTTVIAGALVGFLCHNWPPAKIFMGDAGSMTIGFLAGALSIQASSKTATTFTLGVPLVLMSIPLFDTAMAILRRKLTGRSIGEGDRGHIHHRLQDRGMSRRQALLAISGLTLVMSGAALLSVYLQSESYGLSICGGVLGLLILGRVFGYHETSLVFGRLKELGDLLIDATDVLRTRLLLARLEGLDASQRDRLWDLAVERAAQVKANRLDYQCRAAHDDRLTARLTWENAGGNAEENSPHWQVAYQVPRGDGLIAVLAISGQTGEAPRVDELLRLFARISRELPVNNVEPPSEPIAPQSADHSTVPFPTPVVAEPARHAA
jgi:UDP-GlcNAc:undecaprenyl-phosphate GlcNAc-1-phosphate transferase